MPDPLMTKSVSYLPSIGAVLTGCLCCSPKPEVAPLDWQPHPGFGALDLTRDGRSPEWWDEFCALVRWTYDLGGGWTSLVNVRGETVEYFEGNWYPEWAVEAVTLGEIEECCAEEPDHDWRLRVEGALGGVVYQRQGSAKWVLVERLEGFA